MYRQLQTIKAYLGEAYFCPGVLHSSPCAFTGFGNIWAFLKLNYNKFCTRWLTQLFPLLENGLCHGKGLFVLSTRDAFRCLPATLRQTNFSEAVSGAPQVETCHTTVHSLESGTSPGLYLGSKVLTLFAGSCKCLSPLYPWRSISASEKNLFPQLPCSYNAIFPSSIFFFSMSVVICIP